MDYDDCTEEFSMMDFVEEIHQTWDLEEEIDDDDRTLSAFLNSTWDF